MAADRAPPAARATEGEEAQAAQQRDRQGHEAGEHGHPQAARALPERASVRRAPDPAVPAVVDAGKEDGIDRRKGPDWFAHGVLWTGILVLAFPVYLTFTIISATAVILTAAYYLWSMQRVFLGKLNTAGTNGHSPCFCCMVVMSSSQRVRVACASAVRYARTTSRSPTSRSAATTQTTR